MRQGGGGVNLAGKAPRGGKINEDWRASRAQAGQAFRVKGLPGDAAFVGGDTLGCGIGAHGAGLPGHRTRHQQQDQAQDHGHQSPAQAAHRRPPATVDPGSNAQQQEGRQQQGQAGAIDSISTPNADDIPKATNYLTAAFAEASAGKPVTVSSTKPYGCGVKY